MKLVIHKTYIRKNRWSIMKQELLIFISLFLFLLVEIDKRTSAPVFEEVSTIFKLCACLLVIVDTFIKKSATNFQIILFLIVSGILFVDSLPSSLQFLVFFIIITWGIRDRNIDVYLAFLFKATLVMTVLISLLCIFGIYEDVVFVQQFLGKERIRHSLGFTSWTILPFQYLALTMYYTYLKKENINFVTYLLILIGGFIIFRLTDTKSAFLFLILFVFAGYLLRFYQVKKWKRYRIFLLFPWVITAGSFFLCKMYQNGNSFIEAINRMINNRIAYASKAISMYGIRFLSNGEVQWSGDIDNYLIVDNSYINVLLTWGIIGLVVVLFIYSYLLYYAVRIQDKYLLLVVLFFLLVCTMWDRLLIFPDAEFILLFGYFFTSKERKKKRRMENESCSNNAN